MKLYDEEELRKKNEKSRKMKNLILVSIILTVVLIILLMGVIYYLIYNPNKITIQINNIEDEKIEEMIITRNDYDGSTIVYFPIRSIASKFGYSSNNGDYGRNVENSENCYIESENEVAIFTENSNVIYKIDKTSQRNREDYDYEEIKLDNPIIKENDALYVDIYGLGKSFNLNIITNKKMKKISITTLDTLIALAEKTLTQNNYGNLDEKFANKKALLDNMIVVVAEGSSRKGVIDFTNKDEILGFQYDDITYIPSNESFLVSKDDKVGIVGKDRIPKIKPQYDSLTLIDSTNGLYLAEDNTFFGVIDENGNLKIHSQYKKIGVAVSQYKENDIKNGYVLFGQIIPAQRENDNKWVFYKINSTTNSDGTKNVECNLIQNVDVDAIGCIPNNVSDNKGIVSSLMLIKDYNLVVFQKYGFYGFMDMNGNSALGVVFTNAFIETESGVSDYYAIHLNGNRIRIADELEKKGYTKIK